MSTMREQELNTVNGGMMGGQTLGGSRFNEGDRVMSQALALLRRK